MNHLAHLYLADRSHTSLAGNLLGDWVKGRLAGRFPPQITLGIRLHRTIDSYTDTHPVMHRVFARFEPPYRRYAGILADIYFDYLLANSWEGRHEQPLPSFARQAAQRIAKEWPQAPFTRSRLERLPEVLLSYRTRDGVQAALERVAGRLTRHNPLAYALPVVQRRHEALVTDFEEFFPQLSLFIVREADRLRHTI